jgi:hypothetical protein
MQTSFRNVALASAAFFLIGSQAVAAPLIGSPLDPGAADVGFFNQKVCPTPVACPVNPAFIGATTIIDFSIINNNGVMNISLVPSFTVVTPGDPDPWFFSYVVTNLTTATQVATGLPQVPANFVVLAGNDYEIAVTWTLTPSPNTRITGASWTLTGTTGPDIPVPEPGTLALLGVGLLAGLGFSRRRKLH